MYLKIWAFSAELKPETSTMYLLGIFESEMTGLWGLVLPSFSSSLFFSFDLTGVNEIVQDEQPGVGSEKKIFILDLKFLITHSDDLISIGIISIPYYNSYILSKTTESLWKKSLDSN